MSLVAPPTHSANSVAALTAALADLQIKVSAGDGKVCVDDSGCV